MTQAEVIQQEIQRRLRRPLIVTVNQVDDQLIEAIVTDGRLYASQRVAVRAFADAVHQVRAYNEFTRGLVQHWAVGALFLEIE